MAGCGGLRASHADREHVVGILKAAFVQGRLTKDELDLRLGETPASRTYADWRRSLPTSPPEWSLPGCRVSPSRRGPGHR